MTSDVDSLQELVQIGLLMFVMNTLLLVFSVVVLGDRLLAAAAGLPRRPAARDPGQHQVPAGLEPGLPPGPRPHRLAPCRPSRRASPGSGSSRPTAGRTSRSGGSAGQPGRSTTPTWSRCASRPGTCRSSSSPGSARRRWSSASAGWMVIDGRRHHRHGRLLRAHPQQPVRAGPAAQPAVQHGAVGRRRAEQALRAARHPGRRRRAPGRRRPARPTASSWSTGVSFAYGPTARRCCATSTLSHRPAASGSRSSGRPARASRPSPS